MCVLFKIASPQNLFLDINLIIQTEQYIFVTHLGTHSDNRNLALRIMMDN